MNIAIITSCALCATLWACTGMSGETGAPEPVSSTTLPSDNPDASPDGAASWDKGDEDASRDDAADAAADATSPCHVVELTRVLCDQQGDCPPKVLAETSCAAVRSGATYCVIEIASGDLYTEWSGEPLEGIAGRLRECDEEEEARWREARSDGG